MTEARAWMQRAQKRIADEQEPRAQDVATLDLLRLLMFTDPLSDSGQAA